ncbi:hypothetical protein [Gordonia alkanivorans]|uniref:hypothetical protein n=1 Tax=Gordonia alkanivorans TaxID=84096 RepID=UPI0005A94229|nr:hypothetical protein [Gordonia alkanivorans]
MTHDDHVRHFDYTTMRAAHADTVRISLQRRAIARAQESGAWARLPRSMRRRLAHLTVPGAVASADLILNGAVPVVINSGDYWPWTPRQHPVPAGTSESTPECLELVVDTETDYLWTLHATGFLFVERFELRPPGGS